VQHADHGDFLSFLLLLALLFLLLLFLALHLRDLGGRVPALVAGVQGSFGLIRLVLSVSQLRLASIDALPLVLQVCEVV
jgi:hypothetical protein